METKLTDQRTGVSLHVLLNDHEDLNLPCDSVDQANEFAKLISQGKQPLCLPFALNIEYPMAFAVVVMSLGAYVIDQDGNDDLPF